MPSTALPTAEQRANTAFHSVMETAPMGLLISAALGLGIVGVFQYIFYLDVLPAGWQPLLRHGIAIAIAVFFEALGLFFLITTVRDFSARHRREGWLGAVASLLLLAYAMYEVQHVASTFDRDTPATYATIIGILGTIIVIVRVVELRIALTVTAAVQRDDDRKLIAELTGKLNTLQAEKDDIERRKLQAAEQRRQQEIAAEQQRQQEIAAEVEILRRRLAAQGKKSSGVEGVISQENVLRVAREFMRKNPRVKPTQTTIAQLLGKTERSIRGAFPNGSWDAAISDLFAEINQAQAETTPA